LPRFPKYVGSWRCDISVPILNQGMLVHVSGIRQQLMSNLAVFWK